ncbi:MAG TPA: 30S ribosomal protein S13 [Dehalococcoidia bacterium]|nr:30S ribosomal protein S13 [Dehalococcoidia bacterium]
MARIAGVDIPREKRLEVALRSIYGIGPTLAVRVCQQAGVDPAIKTRDLTEDETGRLRHLIESAYTVEGDLRREVNGNVRRLIEIGSYRGQRHRRGLPLHGQRTRTNARTRRGPRKTVAGRRRARAKK